MFHAFHGCSMPDLSKIGERERLKPRPGDEPHWQRLGAGRFVGFRPPQLGGRGTWFARAYDADTGKYRRHALGDLGALTGHDVFTAAKKAAEAWGETVDAGGIVQRKLETVGDACREYATSRPDAAARFSRLVYGDPVSRVRIDKLRRHHLDEWRTRLDGLPALVSRSPTGEKRTRKRAPATINRDIVPLRAALSKVLAAGAPGSPGAWQEALLPIRNADRQRTAYLDREQRRTLVAAIAKDAKPFVRAMTLLPLRPGAMAALSAGDYNRRTRELTIGSDKSGKPRRITLPQTVADFMAQNMKDKLPEAPLFERANGRRWTKNDWNDPIRAASGIAGYGTAITAYTFRHSVITDLVNGGLAILTVAQISDTSVEMIERHYGHLNRSAAEEALAALV
jgi:integrase